jgi:hypothetical protein
LQPPPEDHTLAVMPRTALHHGELDGVSLAAFEQLMVPLAFTRKFMPCSYALQVGLKAPLWKGSSRNLVPRISASDEVTGS